MIYHIHQYKFDSEISNGHKHVLMGYTDSTIGINSFHFHFFYSVCSYNGHTHCFSGFTGLPLRTANGHIHRMEGFLGSNCLHEHRFKNYTFEDVEYTGKTISKRWVMGSR